MKRTYATTCAVLSAVLLAAVSATAADDAATLKKHLADVEGWTAPAAEGMDVDMGQFAMTNATRTYTKGEASVTVVLIVGSSQMTKAQIPEGLEYETDDAKAAARKLHGCKAALNHMKKENAGAILLILAEGEKKGGLLSLAYKGISQKKAIAFLGDFDVKAMKATAEKLTK